MTSDELIQRSRRTLLRLEDLLNDEDKPSFSFLERVFRDFTVAIELAEGATADDAEDENIYDDED